MYTTRIEKEVVLGLLRIFGALPSSLLIVWLDHFYGVNLTHKTLRALGDDSYLYYDSKDQYCYPFKGAKAKKSSEYCFYVMMRLLKGGEDTVCKARYPFDYIFVHENMLYGLIDFENGGELKLKAFRMLAADKKDAVIPVVVLLHGSEDRFSQRNLNGNYEYIPDVNYILASVKYRIDAPENSKYRLISEEKQANCI